MKKTALILLVATMSIVAACSKTEPQANPVKKEAEAQQVDYKTICEHLIPLSPESRRASFTKACEENYRNLLPACRNAAAVNACFSDLKSWDGRLACMDSCVRDPAPVK